MRYRRAFVSSGSFFFTVLTEDRHRYSALWTLWTSSVEPSRSDQSDKGEAAFTAASLPKPSRLGSMLGTGRGDPAR